MTTERWINRFIQTQNPKSKIQKDNLRRIIIFSSVVLIAALGFLFYKMHFVSSVTYTWIQTDWSGGVDTVSYPLHPTNQTGWTKYWSATSGIKTSAAGQITYNTTSTVSSKSATLPNAKYDTAAVYDSASDKFYIIGGYYLNGSNDPVYLSEIVQYNPSTDVATTISIGSLPVQLRGHAADLNTSDGKIYIFGGYDNTNSQFNSTIYTFDPANPSNNATTTGYSLPSGREYAPAVYAPNVGKFYIFGGYYGTSSPSYLSEIVEFNPSNGSVTTTTNGLPVALKGASAVYYPVDQKIYIFGGYDDAAGDYSDKIYVFDPANPNNGASDTTYVMPSKRAYTTAAYYSSFGAGSIKRMYVFGGYRLTGDTSVYLNEVLKFTGNGNATAQTETLPKNLKAAAAAFNSSDNQIYIFGGYDGNSSAFSDTIYNYKLHFGPLISSPYNTTDPSSILSKIEWTETVPSGTDILFQVRTATNNDNGTPGDSSDDTPDVFTDWCGPDNGGAGCDTTTYFTDSAGGEAVDDIFKDATGDHWIQYRVYLVSDSLNNSPTLSDITVTYVINTSPTVSNISASQDSDGAVNVSYDVTDAEEATTTVYLLYDLGVTLDGDLSATATSVPVSDATYLANSGTIQIDSEQMTYTGKSGNTLTGVTRGVNNTLYYKTSHSNGATVWIKAETVSGDVGAGVTGGAGKSITWTAKTDIDGFYAASTVKVRVVANDGNAARQVGQIDSLIFEFDTKDPVVGTTAVGNTGIDINGNATTSKGVEKTNTLTNTLNLSCTDDTALQVIPSNDGTFDTETYQSYASSISWDLDAYCPEQEYGCVKTVYVKFKDAKGNEIGPYSDTVTLDNNPPAVPSNMFIQDVSNASTSQFRLFITWDKNTESDWIRYEIYRSTDGTNFSLLSTTTDINLNYILETNLTQGQTYYYKVRSVDDIINNSDYSTTVSMVAGGNPTDSVPPTISGVATSTPTINSVTITWSTDEISTSQVIYSTNASVPQGSPTQGVSGYSTSHSVTLTGLNASTTYYFKAKSCDASNNCSESTIYQFITAAPDNTPPVVSNIQSSSITENSATITWDTDEASNSFVEYSTTAGFSSGTLQGDFAFTTSHSVVLQGLNASTTYYYKVRSADSSGNEVISSENSFTTSVSSADVTPPVISNVASSGIAYNTATITWATDENSSSFVEYGLNTSYGSIYGQDDSVTSHSVNIPKTLSPSTTYHFRVRSIDGAGNESFSGDYTFTTAASPNDVTAPVISNVQIGEPQTTGITITWTTDEDADSYIGYSQATTTYSLEQGSPTMTTSHSVTLVGLTPNTTYYFQVKSKDPSGNQQIDNNSGQGYQFTTSASSSDPPVISAIQITDVGSNTATITWTTSKSSDSFVEYGLDTSYGDSQGQYDSATSHSVTLNGLLSEATYHFRVRSTDSDGNEAVSQDYTFTTEQAADITPPVISSVQATNITLSSATITWTTNESTDNIVEYGTATTSLTSVAGSNADSTTSHSVSLSNLSSGTTYYYQVRSRDASGNITMDNNSGSYYSFTTVEDTTAPTISNVASPVVDRNSATITWDTDEDATSQVEYSVNSDLSNSISTTETTDLRQEHSVIISGLTSNTKYYYRAKSKDGSNNLATSSIAYFTTAAASEDSTAPIISSVATSSITMTGAIITWTTDEASNSIVDYGTSVSLGSLAGALGDAVTSHSVSLSGLSQNTTYYFQVRSQDSSGNTGTDNNSGNYYTFTTAQDTTAPIISSVTAAVVNDTSAVITWTTNEDATSQVFYGTTNAYGYQTNEDTNFTKKHSVTLTGLTKQTTYYYKVISKDANSNTATDDNSGSGYSFTTTDEPGIVEYVGGGGVVYVETTGKTDTTAPEISDLKAEEVGETSAVISWSTNEGASSLVEYGTSESYGKIAGDYQVKGTKHEVLLDGLFSGTVYYFRVISYDGWGNQRISKGNNFTTQGSYAETENIPAEEKGLIDQITDILRKFKNPYSFASVSENLKEAARRVVSEPLIAGDYPTVSTSATEAEVVWITDKKANSLVAYVPSEEYDPSKENPYLFTIGNTEEMTTKHSVIISRLLPNTTYHYQVISKPEIGPEAKSGDRVFKTKPINPEIINLQLLEIKEDSARFYWDTNVLTRSNLEYTDLKTGKALTQGEAAFSKKHDFTLKNLNPGTTYSLIVKVTDEYGNNVASPEIKFSTGVDKEPPVIFQVNTDSTLYPGKTTRIQTIISWKTNEPSTGQLFWQEGIAAGTKVYASVKENTLTVNHIVVVTKFKPATVYKFWAESEDAAGNLAKSKEFTLLTPEKTQTVFEMIVENLQKTFSWTKIFNK